MMRITKTAPRKRGILGPNGWPQHRLAKADRNGSGKKCVSDGDSRHAAPPSPFDPVEGKTNRPRIGLALSAGGARGLTHIGVIQVLEENGIRDNSENSLAKALLEDRYRGLEGIN